jgi:FKBP-type peptidyl-prolyl cis-trans isomerase 2
MTAVQLGDRVRVQYCRAPCQPSSSPNGSDTNVLEFTAGSSSVLAGISTGVVGMVPGEQKHFTLQPSEAYGPIQPELIREIPRDQFPRRLSLRVGRPLAATSIEMKRGRRLRVIEIRPQSVIVDGNHRLAGQVVELEVLLISVDLSSEANRSEPQYDLGGQG